jgi:hypothetical protein
MTLLRTYRGRPALSALVGMILIAPAVMLACPICSSPTGQQVRKGIFGDDFWGTLLVVVSPFPVLLLCIAAYYYGLPKFGRPSSPQRQVLQHGRYE